MKICKICLQQFETLYRTKTGREFQNCHDCQSQIFYDRGQKLKKIDMEKKNLLKLKQQLWTEITCIKCKITKPISEFFFRKKTQTYIRRCKKCKNDGEREKYRTSNHKKNKVYEWRRKNPEKEKEIKRKYINKHKERLDKNRRDSRIKNREKKNQQSLASYYNRTPEAKQRQREKTRLRETLRRKIDVQFRMKQSLRSRIWSALHKNLNGGKIKHFKSNILLGCSIEEWKSFLEQKFQPGMSWVNYGTGRKKWTVDHIIPVNQFDLTKPHQQKLAFHYMNTQPMWWIDNIKKGDKINQYIFYLDNESDNLFLWS